MGTLPTFSNGQASSASQLMTAMESVQATGNTVIQGLVNANVNMLQQMQRRLNVLNGKSQRTSQILPRGVLAKFNLNDMTLIDQTQTTCQVRADSNCATLSEKVNFTQLQADSIQFTTNIGNIQTIDQAYNLYQVYSTGGLIPVGTFTIKLAEPLDISILSFDLSSLSSTPGIQVQVSQSGVSYTPANSVSLSGYNLVAYINSVGINFIQVILTPSQPDNLGGDTYTLGLTSLSALISSFYLASDLLTTVFPVTPITANWYLNAPNLPGVSYYLGVIISNNGSLSSLSFTEIVPGQLYPIPGISIVSNTNLAYDFDITTDNAIPQSIQAIQYNNDGSVEAVPVLNAIEGGIGVMSFFEDRLPRITPQNNYVNYDGTYTLVWPGVNGVPIDSTFNLNYLQQDPTQQVVGVALKIHMKSNNSSITPVLASSSLVGV